jgi:hypothetical protein
LEQPDYASRSKKRKQDFSLARQKVKWEAFRELFRASVKGSYNETIKDWFIGILITDDRLARKYLYRELVSEIRWRIVPIRPIGTYQEKTI